MPYNPSLDVLRVFAVFLVMGWHCWLPVFDGGWIGVDLFFVLSGFLITKLLLAEEEKTGRINLPKFWLRRLKRLAPALLALITVYMAVAPMIWPAYEHAARDSLISSVYLMDYWRGYFGTSKHLGHTWSLAVEEHYYIVWPIILMAVLKAPKERQRSCMLIMIGAAMILRWYLIEEGHSWKEVYYSTHTRLTGLLLGSSAAMFYRPLKFNPSSVLLAGFATFFWAKLLVAGQPTTLELRLPMLMAEVGALLMILACVQFPRILALTGLAPLGKYTYGIYLWHYPIIAALVPLHDDRWLLLASASALSIGFAALSYHTVERFYRAAPSDHATRRIITSVK